MILPALPAFFVENNKAEEAAETAEAAVAAVAVVGDVKFFFVSYYF